MDADEKFSPDAVVRAGDRQVSSDLNDEAVILHLGSGTYYSLNQVGARVWALIQSPTRVRDLHTALLAEFDVEPRRLARDLVALLHELDTKQLIHVAPGGAR